MSINTDWCTAKDALDYETSLEMASKYDLNKRDDLLAFVFDILDYQSARSAYLCETLAAEHPDGADLFMMPQTRFWQRQSWLLRIETKMSIEAMKQALEALTIAQDSCIHGEMAEPSPIFDEAINTLRAAIEQAEQAVIAERAACAKTCEEAGTDENGEVHLIAWECAAAIRARGEK